MTADGATFAGEHHQQQAKNTQISHHAASDLAIRMLGAVPDLDWRTDLFACAIVDDYEADDERAPNDWSHVLMHELPDSDDNHGIANWQHQPAHPGILAGVAP